MATINLTPGDDNYTAGTAGDVIYGLAGNDTLQASSGGNVLRGGDGNDVVYGGHGDDTLYGDDSTNFTYHNTLQGGGGNDAIISYSWYDQVLGGAGDDAVISTAMTTGQGLDGGNGYDLIHIQSLTGSTHSVYLNFGSVFTPIIDGINGASYSNFEVLKITGGTGAQTIFGGAGDDTIYNSPSNVSALDAGTLNGRGGNDLIAIYGIVNPGTGTEMLSGGAGADMLEGDNYGAGFDFASYANAAKGVRADLGNAATNTGDAAGDSYNSIEGLIGSHHADMLFGDSGDNQLIGALGKDLLSGGDGNDTLMGGGRSDHLNGGAGNDELNGGAGNDLLSGNKGHDTFVFVDGFGHDTISHFSASNLEKIDLSALTTITGFNSLVNHHLFDDPGGNGFALIDDGAGNTILLDHVAKSDIGAGDVYSAADFII